FEERADAGDGAHLEIGWVPVLMAGPYLGVDVTATVTGEGTTPGTGVRAAHRTVYADVTADRDADAWAAPGDLFAPDAADPIAGLVRRAFNQPRLAGLPHPSAAEAAEAAQWAMSTARLHADG